MKNIGYKKGIVFGLLLLFAGVSISPLVSSFNINTDPTGFIYVDDDNIEGPWNGTLLHPYRGVGGQSVFAGVPISSLDVIQNKDIVSNNNLDSPIHERKSSYNTDWWPMFRHDPQHSGYSTSKGPETNTVLWNYTTGDYVMSSPAVIDFKVYIGSDDGKIYCLTQETGEKIWNYSTDGSIFSSPAVMDGKVYFTSYDGKVYCLNADSGEKIWNYTTGGWMRSSPAVMDGKVYFGGGDGKIYCLDADTGDKIWDYPTYPTIIYASPAIYDGKVYISGADGCFYCLDADTGEKIWHYQTWSNEESSPAIYEGKVYFGSHDHRVYCLNAYTGEIIWVYTTGNAVQADPAVFEGKVYIGSKDTNVYCLNADNGSLIWSYLTGGYVWTSPAVADGKIYVGADDKVYCFNMYTGEKIWHYTTGHILISSPTVVDGKVYIGSCDNKIYCFEDTNSPPNKPTIIGLPFGRVGKEYTFRFRAVDPDGDDLYYYIDWGDGTFEEWIGSYSSGDFVNVKHTWTSAGEFFIKAKVKDLSVVESDWTEFKVNMLRNKATNNMLLLRFLQQFPLFERFLYFIL